MEHLRVAFISYFYPNTMVGGASIYASNICSALREFADVTVIVPKLNKDRIIRRQGVDHILCDAIDLPLLRSTSFYAMMLRRVELDGFDVVHLNGGAAIFPKQVDVVTFHHKIEGIGLITYGSHFMQKLSLRKARAVIAVSERSREELINMGFKSKKVFVVHNGVDHGHFTPSLNPNAAKNRLNVKEERVLLYVGSEGMSKRKNMLLLLKLMRRVNADLLLIVSQRKDRVKFMSLAEKLGLSKRIRYDCDVPSNILPYYYSASDLLVYPSLHEGFGLVLLEAISSGKPFISMDVGIASLLAEKGFGYVARTEEEFIEKCMLMLKNPLQVGWRGNEFVRNNFSWRECARKTMKVYEEIITMQ